MPLIFRIMKSDPDGLPNVAPSPNGLGVRSMGGPSPKPDISVDQHGRVFAGAEGMSVNTNWRHAPLHRIPARLRSIKSGARGSEAHACFRHGSGAFTRGPVAEGLKLEPDDVPNPTHGVVTPASSISIAEYEAHLAATRPDWEKDER